MKVSASDCNSSWQPEMAIWPPKPEILISLELCRNSNGKSDIFDQDELDTSVAKRLRQRPLTGNGNTCVLGANLVISGWYSCWNHLAALLSRSSRSIMLVLPLEFQAICHSSRYTSVSGFGGHIAVSGCRSMLQSLADTFFKLYMVVNPRFCHWNFNAISSSFRDISISGFGVHFRSAITIGIAYRHSLRVRHGRKPWIRSWNKDKIK